MINGFTLRYTNMANWILYFYMVSPAQNVLLSIVPIVSSLNPISYIPDRTTRQLLGLQLDSRDGVDITGHRLSQGELRLRRSEFVEPRHPRFAV